MHLKFMRFLLVVLVLLEAGMRFSFAEETNANILIKNAIMDADEVRILHSLSDSFETLTGYRSKTLKGRKLLAEIFSKADFRGLGNPDGTQDPTGGGGFNTYCSLILNTYKNKRLTCQMIIVAGDYIRLVVPKDVWYLTSFDSIAKDQSPADANASAIEDIIRRDVEKISSAGDFEKALSWTGDYDRVDAQIEGFMPGIVKPAAAKEGSPK